MGDGIVGDGVRAKKKRGNDVISCLAAIVVTSCLKEQGRR